MISLIKCINDISPSSAQKGQCGTIDYYCLTCKHALCDKCCNNHKKTTSIHLIKKLNEIIHNYSESHEQTKVVTCSPDSEHKLTWFCLKCDQATCNSCYELFHRHHRFISIEQVLSCNSSALKHMNKADEAVNEERQKLRQEVKRVVADVKKLLMKEFDRICNIIDTKASDYIRSIEYAPDNKVKQVLHDNMSEAKIVGKLQKNIAPKANGRQLQTPVAATASTKPKANSNTESLCDMTDDFDSLHSDVTKWSSDIKKWLQPVLNATAQLSKLPFMKANINGENPVNG